MSNNINPSQKEYAINRLSEMARYRLVYEEICNPEIALKYNFPVYTATYSSFWQVFQKKVVRKKIDRLRQNYIEKLKKDIPLIDDIVKIDYLQKIADNPFTAERDKIKAIEAIHKIQQTPLWQKSLASSGNGITLQMVENLLASKLVNYATG